MASTLSNAAKQLSTAVYNYYQSRWAIGLPTSKELHAVLKARDVVEEALEFDRPEELEPTMISLTSDQLHYLLVCNGGAGLTGQMWAMLLHTAPRQQTDIAHPVSSDSLPQCFDDLDTSDEEEERMPEMPGIQARKSKSQKRKEQRQRARERKHAKKAGKA
jgi:hypothetical protein